MGKQKEFTGVVVSDKMQKTVVVRVLQIGKHPKYKKTIKKYNKFKAHDEKNLAKTGDTVLIEETRPLSRDKRFRVVNVVKKAQDDHLKYKETTE
ncbi:MAG: 30S ribosomal protein S17 [Candidatus Omnitrophica bacterium]|nr:30S ribosomal protein S17 [Candidatus Omnitrophota bacterium]